MIRAAIAVALIAVALSACVLLPIGDPASLPGPLAGLGLAVLLVLGGIACFVLELAQAARRP